MCPVRKIIYLRYKEKHYTNVNFLYGSKTGGADNVVQEKKKQKQKKGKIAKIKSQKNIIGNSTVMADETVISEVNRNDTVLDDFSQKNTTPNKTIMYLMIMM